MRFKTDVGQYKDKKRTQVSKWPQDYFFHMVVSTFKYKINCIFNYKTKGHEIDFFNY